MEGIFFSFQMIWKLSPHVAEIKSYDARNTPRQCAITKITFREKQLQSLEVTHYKTYALNLIANFSTFTDICWKFLWTDDFLILNLSKKCQNLKIDSDTHFKLMILWLWTPFTQKRRLEYIPHSAILGRISAVVASTGGHNGPDSVKPKPRL